MSDTPKPPTIHPDGDTVCTVRQLCDMQTAIGRDAIYAAMADGSLPSRVVGDAKRVTTWSAFLRWAEGRDARPTTTATATTDGVDG